MINKIKILPVAVALFGLGFASFVLAGPAKPGVEHNDEKPSSEPMNMQSDEEISVYTPKEKLTGEGVIKLSDRLVLPKMDAERGKELFAAKGCVMCHAINGVGGAEATDLSASKMDKVMNPFDMAARMWKTAPVMAILQENEIGAQILFSGDELADIIAFLHSQEEQDEFSIDDLSPKMQKMLEEHG